MSKSNYNIRDLINILDTGKLNFEIVSPIIFHDEPRFYHYVGLIIDRKKKTEITSNGFSFFSKHKALLICLSELIERYALHNFSKKNAIKSQFNQINNKALNPSLYCNHSDDTYFYWIKGQNLTKGQDYLLPAQLIYLYNFNDEQKLSVSISTGAAAGFNREQVLLNGIYEVIERDAFMTTFLNKIPAIRLDLSSVKNKELGFIVEKLQRYHLELYVFDITNDLEIPVFLAIVIDRSGFGPAVTVGAKAGFNIKQGILGALGEALISRNVLRYRYMHSGEDFVFRLHKYAFIKYALNWYALKNIKKIKFLINQKPQFFKKRVSQYKRKRFS